MRQKKIYFLNLSIIIFLVSLFLFATKGVAVTIDPATLNIIIPLQYPYDLQDRDISLGFVNEGEEAYVDIEIKNDNSEENCLEQGIEPDSYHPCNESIYIFPSAITQTGSEEFTVNYPLPPEGYWLLHPGDSLPIEVCFHPNSTGEKTMELSITFDGANTQTDHTFKIIFTAEGQASLSPPWRYRHRYRVNQNYSIP